MSQPPSNASSLLGQRMGKYELVALVARGGTAEIYLARIDGVAGFEKYVVVKLLHDYLADDGDFVHMFLDEARLTAQLDHSNIAQTLELGEEGGRYYIVMEYLAGMALSLIARRASERAPGGRIPVELTLGILSQACAGLHYAHHKTDASGQPLNIVHRDVSPQNLVVSFEGIVKVVDFGIAKAEMRATQTQSGTIKGKFSYMSPEQCLANHVDHRTDVFALGIIAHELLTGQRLFKRQSTYETYRAIVDGKVPAPSDVNHELDPALDDVVMKALAYDREDRYPTAEAFGEAMSAMLHKRGKSVTAGAVAAFFERYFSKEIDEHAQRMRELIAGRQTIMEELWDDEPELSGEEEDDLDDVLLRGESGEMSGLEAAIRSTDSVTELRSAGPAGGEGDEAATRVEMSHMDEDLLTGPGKDAAATQPGEDLATAPGDSAGQGGAAARSGMRGSSSSPDTFMPSPVEVVAERRASGELPRPPVVAAALEGPKGRRQSTLSDDFSMATMKTEPAGPRGLMAARNGGRQQQDTERVEPLFEAELAATLAAPAAPRDEPAAHRDHAGPAPKPAPLPRARDDARDPAPSRPERAPPRRSHTHTAVAVERAPAPLPLWILVLTFVVCCGVGLGTTLLVARLL